ncbi:MAG: sulfotransferase family protein [Gammaproteobacteria bacterium]|nr:sulfotransferase family protein [Gammaproteobacteria bacterium]
MHPVYILWATPRSTSTAFEWMMRMRGDMACFHEPFGQAWYQGDDARAPRLDANSPRKPGLNFAGVVDRLQSAALKHPVFSKDMPQFTDHLWSDEFLVRFEHSFLIRDPAKVLASLHRSWLKADNVEGFTRNEIGFDEQRRLFDLLHSKSNQPPVVIDSDDLLDDPHAMVEQYCAAIGVPFIAGALSWEPGSRSEVLWYDGDDSIWHESLKNSNGLKAQPRKTIEVEELPRKLQALYDEFLPHYQHLHRFRLRPKAINSESSN